MAYGKFSKEQDAKAVMDDGHKPPKLHHIHIEPTDNGFMVESHHQSSKPTAKDGPAMHEHDITKHHFNSHEEAAAHADDVMAHHAEHHMKASATRGDEMRRNSVRDEEEISR